jgi:hypothetical protein
MLKEKKITSRLISRVLTMALISSVFAGIPSANAALVLQVHDSASLIAAGINPAVTGVQINQNIALSTNLVINHDMTITRGDLFTTGVPMISGAGIEINSGAMVTMDYLGLSGANLQAGGAYGVTLQDGSRLTASYITMTMDSVSSNNTGFLVAPGSTLSLSNSTIDWGTNAATSQQYAVYAQSGAGAISLSLNTFKFNSANVLNNYSCLLGTEGTSVASYPNLTLTGNTSNAYVKLMMWGADSVANKQVWANNYLTAIEGDNRAGILNSFNNDITNGVYTKFATNWGAGTFAPGTTQNLQNRLFAVPDRLTLQLGETTLMRPFGGSGTGLHTYQTTTPSICSVDSTGLVTGIAAGECLFSITKAGSGNYFAANSPVIAITISDSDAIAAAALAKASLSTITYTLTTKTNTIYIDLADKYGYEIVFVDVKKYILVNGKSVLSYVRIDTAILDEFGAVTVKTTIGIKAGNKIRVSIIGATADTPVKYVTVA